MSEVPALAEALEDEMWVKDDDAAALKKIQGESATTVSSIGTLEGA